MKKKVWIMNHYATGMFYDQNGRHFLFAENLKARGYEPTVFTASTMHTRNDVVDTGDRKYSVRQSAEIPFVFVRTTPYTGNGLSRIRNMVTFAANLVAVAGDYAEQNGKPDIVIASSVHPLTLKAGIRIARKFNIPCICEIRDLWPASLTVYGSLQDDSAVAKLLYRAEKKIYEQADRLIFTMAGGRDYIADKKWDTAQGGPVDPAKIFHINNGVVNQKFQENIRTKPLADPDLHSDRFFNVIYTGSIRRVNEVGEIINIVEYLQQEGHRDIRFLIYGEGDERERLEQYCRDQHITNVIFKGRVTRDQVPYVLSKSDLNILHFKQSRLKKYGASLNKLFEYFASGRPILSDCEFGYDLIRRYECGVVVDGGNAREMGEAIIKVRNLSQEDYDLMCANALKAARDHDFSKLTDALIEVIEGA